jgi:hypothetical protein
MKKRITRVSFAARVAVENIEAIKMEKKSETDATLEANYSSRM